MGPRTTAARITGAWGMAAGAVLLLATACGGGSGPATIETARDFKAVMQSHDIDCDHFGNYDVDNDDGTAQFDLAHFEGTLTDAGRCELDEADLAPEPDWEFGDAAALIDTDIYSFGTQADTTHYVGLIKRNGCGDGSDNYMIAYGKTWIAVMEYDGTDKVPAKVADVTGGKWARIPC